MELLGAIPARTTVVLDPMAVVLDPRALARDPLARVPVPMGPALVQIIAVPALIFAVPDPRGRAIIAAPVHKEPCLPVLLVRIIVALVQTVVVPVRIIVVPVRIIVVPVRLPAEADGTSRWSWMRRRPRRSLRPWPRSLPKRLSPSPRTPRTTLNRRFSGFASSGCLC